jgi:hypothetical protein
MPAVFKIYAECEPHANASSGIREAVEYAVSRFYAFHEESFVFQSIDAMANIIALPRADAHWMAKNIYMLFSTLKNNTTAATPVAAGIRDLNKAQEKEAILLHAAEEVPQTVLANLRRGGAYGDMPVVGDFHEYEDKRLGLGNFVRLFLTVIAHNPTILRAERFLRLLRYLTPSIYNATSSARAVLRDGIEALGLIILTKAAAKAKVPELAQIRPSEKTSVEIFSQDIPLDDVLGVNHSSPSDLSVMRLDYLALVVAFVDTGGEISALAFQRIVELIRTILRDPSKLSRVRVQDFLADFSRSSLFSAATPPGPKRVVSFLGQIKPILISHVAVLDLHKFYLVLVDLASNVTYSSDPLFCRAVTQLCAAGLEACAHAADGHLLSDNMNHALVRLVCALISLNHTDILAEIEKYGESSQILTFIVLPLVTMMKSVADDDMKQHEELWKHDTYRRAWIRLLAFAMAFCENSRGEGNLTRSNSSGPGLERTKSQGKRGGSIVDRNIMVAVVAIQVVKIIVVRAQSELSNSLSGIWNRLGILLQSWLIDGDGTFALVQQDPGPSPSSPIQSPMSKQFPLSPTGEGRPSLDIRVSTDARPNGARPRIIDFLTWSLLELLCIRRLPLMLQLRSFMQERVVKLDRQLRARDDDPFASLPSPRSRRASAAFSKPRRPSFASGASSPRMSVHMPSPGASPVQPARTPPRLSIGAPLLRRPGYDLPSPTGLSPNAPPPRAGPKIVHLGPVRQNSAGFGFGFGFGAEATTRRRLATLLGSATVRSPALVRRTYARIRLVQEALGYSRLVPAYDEEHGSDEVPEVRACTRAQAVRSIKEDTDALIEELRLMDIGDDEMVVVDAEAPKLMGAVTPQGF